MMAPTNRNHCSGTLSPDVLSNLPENVMDDIIMCLPLRDAVRTSILSKNWRYKWCRLPQLTLDLTLWKTMKVLSLSNLTEIIDHILSLRVGPIIKFTLRFDCFRSCPNIDNLIYFLSRNGIQHLVLKFPGMGNKYELPSSFFTCLQLRHLILENCLVFPPPAFKGFDRIISLELRRVTISSKSLGSLISRTPFLELLVLQVSGLTDVVEINAPTLRYFVFVGSLSSIYFKHIPLLVKMSLVDTNLYYLSTARTCYIGKFFRSFSALEHLHLSDMFFPPGEGEVRTTLPFVLHCVKCLHLSGMCVDPLDVVSSALCLIRSFPYLQYLEIQVKDFYNEFPVPESSLQVERFSDVTFNHLKEVKFEGFIGAKPEWIFMKLLLAKSAVLIRMLIMFGHRPEESAREKILAWLSQCKTASSKAEVYFIF